MRRASDFVLVSCLIACAIIGLASEDHEQGMPSRGPAMLSWISPAEAAPLAQSDRKISHAAAELVDRIAVAHDNHGEPFVIVDKVVAMLYVFHSDGRLAAATPVLLGSARGDDTVPDIGSRAIADVRPEERTTPAGRFIGEMGRNMRGEDVVWVDYDAAVSMHRVLTTNRSERRLERLQTPSAEDNRISYGCINVPANFYVSRLQPLFRRARTPIYILPELHSLDEVFQFHGPRPKGRQAGD